MTLIVLLSFQASLEYRRKLIDAFEVRMASLPFSTSRYFPFCFFEYTSQFHYQLGHVPRALTTDLSELLAESACLRM